MNNFDIPSDLWPNVKRFSQILRQFNSVHNLTNYQDSIKEVAKDSIEGLSYIQNYPKVAIDIGSGAGIPAVFLALVLKESTFYLFEPDAKKAAFLIYAKSFLNLLNVKVISSKIEDAKKFKADLITSRAVMSTPKLLEICKGFYDKNSEILLYKGSEAKKELKDLLKNASIYKSKSLKTRRYVVIKGIK